MNTLLFSRAILALVMGIILFRCVFDFVFWTLINFIFAYMLLYKADANTHANFLKRKKQHTNRLIYLWGMAACSLWKLWKNGAIWCILKCILIKSQVKNRLKISVFIATTTKKTTKLLGRYGECSPGKILKNGAI